MFVGLILAFIALGLKGHILVTLNHDIMFFLVMDLFKALSTHPIRTILSSSLNLLRAMGPFFSF
jgi:hypothetical protein